MSRERPAPEPMRSGREKSMAHEDALRLDRGTGSSKPTPGARHFALALFLVTCLFVGVATLLPFQFTLDRIGEQLERSPSFLQRERPVMPSDLIGNVVLFLPVGFFGALMQPRKRRSSRARLAIAGCYGFLLSCGIELVQWFTPSRAPALSDIACNTLGALWGAGVMELFAVPLARSRWRQRSLASMRGDSSVLAFLGALLLTSVWAMVPFDASLHPHILARALRSFRGDPFRGSVPLLDLTHCLLMALSAGAGMRWLHQHRPRLWLRNAGMVLGFLGAWALVLEVLQLALTSRTPTLLDAVTGAAGALTGILVILAIEPVRDEDARRHGATFAYVAGLLLLALRPLGTGFGAEVLRRRISTFIPGYGPHFDATLCGVTEFVHGLLLFAPLGYLSTAALRRFGSRSGAITRFSAPLAGAAVALIMQALMAMAMHSGAPAPAGVLAACLGGVLGVSARTAQGQLEGDQERDGSFQTGTGLARKHDAESATARPPLA